MGFKYQEEKEVLMVVRAVLRWHTESCIHMSQEMVIQLREGLICKLALTMKPLKHVIIWQQATVNKA